MFDDKIYQVHTTLTEGISDLKAVAFFYPPLL